MSYFCPWLVLARKPVELKKVWLDLAPEMSYRKFLSILPMFNVRILFNEFGDWFAYQADVPDEMIRLAAKVSMFPDIDDLVATTFEVYHSGKTLAQFFGDRYGYLR
jgi:hypothetical protein